MSERDFCFWLSGYFEIAGVGAIPLAQAEIIRDRLAGVFQKLPPPPPLRAHADDGTN